MTSQTFQKRSVLNWAILVFSILLVPKPSAVWASTRKLTINEVLQLAEKTSPDLKAGVARENQAKAGVDISKSTLYPQFHLSAVDSWGFPGSSVPVPPQFGGLIASPFRVGPGAGIIGKITLLDLGNWRGVDTSEAQTASAQEQNRVIRIKIDQEALGVFFESTRYHGHRRVWEGIQEKVDAILKVVRKFVKNGQYADVQRLLIEDQFEEAKMRQGIFEERYRGALRRLALLTGLDETEVESPIPLEFTEENVSLITPGVKSPFLTRAEAETQVARAKVSQSSAEHLPKIFALGSAGVLNGARLVESDNYSAWVGITLPLFEGFRITSEVHRAQAVVDEKENDLASARLGLDELNARFDENIRTAKLQLSLLQGQHKGAVEAFKQAKDRFLSFLGPVVDLREAVRDLARIEIDMNDAKMDLLFAMGSKALVNGGSISQK